MRTFTISVFLVCALIVAGPSAQEQDSDTNNEEPQIIQLVNGQKAISWKDQVYGPHYFLIVHGVFEDQLLYSAQDEERLWHAYWGTEHYGPFKDLMVSGVYQGKILFYCMDDDDYFVRWGKKRKGPYDWVWKLRHDQTDGMVHFRIRYHSLTNDIHWDGN